MICPAGHHGTPASGAVHTVHIPVVTPVHVMLASLAHPPAGLHACSLLCYKHLGTLGL